MILANNNVITIQVHKGAITAAAASEMPRDNTKKYFDAMTSAQAPVIIKVRTLLQLQGNKNSQLKLMPSPLIRMRPIMGELVKNFIMV